MGATDTQDREIHDSVRFTSRYMETDKGAIHRHGSSIELIHGNRPVYTMDGVLLEIVSTRADTTWDFQTDIRGPKVAMKFR